MSEPKRHHFISQMQLRRFVGPNRKLFSFDKSRSEKRVLERSPKSIFFERDLYSSIAKDGTRNATLEKQFAEIEHHAHQIIGKMIEAAKAGSLAVLSPAEKRSWHKFFYFQWCRVPDLHRYMLSDFETMLPRATAEFEQEVRLLSPEERLALEDPKVRARMEQNARVKAMGSEGEALDTLHAWGIQVSVVVVPNEELVIGSYPLVAMRKADGIPDNATGVWLPIAPTVAVSPAPTRTDQLQRWSETGLVQEINEATFRQSTIIAGRSRSLIASIAGLG